jgi:hypothetical protein
MGNVKGGMKKLVDRPKNTLCVGARKASMLGQWDKNTSACLAQIKNQEASHDAHSPSCFGSFVIDRPCGPDGMRRR